jgi:hypothetical protein
MFFGLSKSPRVPRFARNRLPLRSLGWDEPAQGGLRNAGLDAAEDFHSI